MIFLRQPINYANKQVLWRNKSNLLKCKLFTLERTIFIFFERIQRDGRDLRITVSYQIKRKRERKKKKTARKKNTTPPFSPIPEIMFSYVLFISFLINMQG